MRAIKSRHTPYLSYNFLYRLRACRDFIAQIVKNTLINSLPFTVKSLIITLMNEHRGPNTHRSPFLTAASKDVLRDDIGRVDVIQNRNILFTHNNIQHVTYNDILYR